MFRCQEEDEGNSSEHSAYILGFRRLFYLLPTSIRFKF